MCEKYNLSDEVEVDMEKERIVFKQAKKPKPPIGITPRGIWLMDRYEKLKSAIKRYMDADLNVSVEWITEFNQLQEELKEDTKE